MAIEQTIFSRLNDSSITSYTSTRIYNCDPLTDTDFPFVVYTITATEPDVVLGKATGNTTYQVSVDIWCKSVVDRRAIEQAVKGRLHVYTGSGVQLSRLQSEQAEVIGTHEEGDVYHGTQVYQVMAQV